MYWELLISTFLFVTAAWLLLSYYGNLLDKRQDKVYNIVLTTQENLQQQNLISTGQQKKSKFATPDRRKHKRPSVTDRPAMKRSNSFDEDQSPTRQQQLYTERRKLDLKSRDHSRNNSRQNSYQQSNEDFERQEQDRRSYSNQKADVFNAKDYYTTNFVVQEVKEDCSPERKFKPQRENSANRSVVMSQQLRPPTSQYGTPKVRRNQFQINLNKVSVAQSANNLDYSPHSQVIQYSEQQPSIHAGSRQDYFDEVKESSIRSQSIQQFPNINLSHQPRTQKKKATITMGDGSEVTIYKLPNEVYKSKKKSQSPHNFNTSPTTTPMNQNLTVAVTSPQGHKRNYSDTRVQNQSNFQNYQDINLEQHQLQPKQTEPKKQVKEIPCHKLNVITKIFSKSNDSVSRRYKLTQIYVRYLEASVIIETLLLNQIDIRFSNWIIVVTPSIFVIIKKFIDIRFKGVMKKSFNQTSNELLAERIIVGVLNTIELIGSLIANILFFIEGVNFKLWFLDQLAPTIIDLILLEPIQQIILKYAIDKEEQVENDEKMQSSVSV